MKSKHPGNERKKRALLVLPLLVIPFVTMAFWALGGGKGETQKQTAEVGLNLQLPDAHLKEEEENKMRFYEAAEKDSARWREGLKNDPFFRLSHPPVDTPLFFFNSEKPASFDPLSAGGYQDPNEAKVYQKLAALKQQLNSTPSKINNSAPSIEKNLLGKDHTVFAKGDVDRLENMMERLQPGGDRDPELEEINQMMEKILDIQHPERVKERSKEKLPALKRGVITVSKEPLPASVSFIDTTGQNPGTDALPGFFGLEDEKRPEQNAIRAVVHENQSLVSGAVVKLRLQDAIYLGGSLLPKGSLVFGTASLNGERLHVEITSVRSDSGIFPVSLDVYDLDGLPGIYVPGSITREVAKGSADNSLQMLETTSLDPSLKAQVATAGVSAAKSLLSKKAKRIKVTVKAGYKVLLKDKSALSDF
jgi:conjugative transposon TraM protein